MSTHLKAPTNKPGVDRFLVAILAGIGMLLAAGAVSIIFSRQSSPDLPVDTPGGTTQLFLKALEQHNYEQAYGLLSANMEHKPSLGEFTRYNADQANYNQSYVRIRLNSEKISGNTAIVEMIFTNFYYSGSPFSGSSENNSFESFSLAREAGNWRLNSLSPRFIPPNYAAETGLFNRKNGE